MMKRPRRLGGADTSDPYQLATRAPLRHTVLSEERFRELEQKWPDLIAVEGESVLAALPQPQRIDLVYGFRDRDAFARDFPGMLRRLLPSISPHDAPLGIYFRLLEAPARSYVEPILVTDAFELTREWLRMDLHELPDVPMPDDDVAPGFVLRPATPDDADEIVDLDAVSFPASFLNSQVVRDEMQSTPLLRVLEDSAVGRVVGFLRLRIDTPPDGYVLDIAIHPTYHRRGLGEAAMRWALGWFRSQGLSGAALTVNMDNAPAIALYRKLGFAAGQTGLDYRRPIDKDEVQQVLDKHRAQHISVRKRY